MSGTDEQAEATAMAIQALVEAMPEGCQVAVIISEESGEVMACGTCGVPDLVRRAHEHFVSGNMVHGMQPDGAMEGYAERPHGVGVPDGE